jgi:hypothetical protein
MKICTQNWAHAPAIQHNNNCLCNPHTNLRDLVLTLSTWTWKYFGVIYVASCIVNWHYKDLCQNGFGRWIPEFIMNLARCYTSKILSRMPPIWAPAPAIAHNERCQATQKFAPTRRKTPKTILHNPQRLKPCYLTEKYSVKHVGIIYIIYEFHTQRLNGPF